VAKEIGTSPGTNGVSDVTLPAIKHSTAQEQAAKVALLCFPAGMRLNWCTGLMPALSLS
jgi:hypothetical protein